MAKRTWVWMLCCVAFLVFAPAAVQPAAASDVDNDGIDDQLELTLAMANFPRLYYQLGEQCPAPRQVLFRARHPSVNGRHFTNFILINYVHLFDEDCGDLGHNGDNEPFAVWLKKEGTGWRFEAIAATAHWGTANETKTSSYSNEIWIGQNKHGHYADPNECGVPFSFDDRCAGPTQLLSHSLYNVGEPWHHLLNDLGDINGRWGDEDVWYDNKFLSAGHIRSQLFHHEHRWRSPVPVPFPFVGVWDGEPYEAVGPPPTSQPPGQPVSCAVPVALQAVNGQWVAAEGGGNSYLIANRNDPGIWETFCLIDQGGGNIALQAYFGQYVVAEGGGGGEVLANRSAIGIWETFRLIDLGGGYIALQAHNGQYVVAEGGGGQPLRADRNGIGAWEIFYLRYF